MLDPFSRSTILAVIAAMIIMGLLTFLYLAQ